MTTAVIIAAAFGSVFVLARHALPGLVIAVAIFFLLFSLSVRSRIVSASLGAAKVLTVDGWVDARVHTAASPS